MTIAERDKKSVWHPYTQAGIFPDSIAIQSGKGALLFDHTGNSYIDAISSWWVNLHGHANDEIGKAVKDQLDKLEQVIFAGFTHEPAVVLAEQLLALFPYLGKAFYSDNGSTAVEVALKIAIQRQRNTGGKRLKILAFEDAYHGDTFGAMALSSRSLFTAPFEHLLFDIVRLPLPTEGVDDAYESRLNKILSTGDIAAFIYEPLVLGSGGMLMYDHKDLELILRRIKQENVLLIADEVLTGFGRTGTLFASDQMTTKPDLVCLSKGLTGGYLPLGVTLVSEEVYKDFVSSDFNKTFFHGHSFTGNLLSCAAAVASLKLTLSKECEDNRKRIEDAHIGFAHELTVFKCIEHVRLKGTILAFDICVSDAGYGSNIRKEILEYFLSRGILLRPLGNVLYILPPYVITNEQLRECYDAILLFLEQLELKYTP